MAYLIGTFQENNFGIDSARVDASGKFVFQNKQPYHIGTVFCLLPNNSNFQILMDQDQTFSMKTKAADLYGSMQVQGSIDNELLYQSIKFDEGQRPKLQAVAAKMAGFAANSQEYNQARQEQYQLMDERKAYLEGLFKQQPNALFTRFKSAGKNPDIRDAFKPDGSLDTARYSYLYRTHFWDDVNFADERLMFTPVIPNKLKRYMEELTVQQPDSIKSSAAFLVNRVLKYPEFFKYFANWITLKYEPTKTTLMDSEAVFAFMIQNYFTYDRAFWSDSVEVHGLQLRAHEMSQSLVGLKGPDVQAADPTGKMHSIYEMKSDYIVVYMWNPDCEHCAEQTPKLVQAYPNMKSQGIDVFSIAVNTEDAKWKSSIAKYKMPWVNVMDPTNKAIYAKYFVDNTPEIYVLNPDRIIIGKNLKVEQIPIVVDRDKKNRNS
jgi:peroxiredoxin